MVKNNVEKDSNSDFIDHLIDGGRKCLARSKSGLE